MAAKKKKSKKKARKRAPVRGGRGPLTPRLAIAGLRVFIGAIFLQVFEYKVLSQGLPLADAIDQFVSKDYVPLIQAAVADPPKFFGAPWTGFASFLETVMLADGWKTFFAASILFFEGLLGLALVFGACTRLFAGLGALLMIAFGLSKRMFLLTGTGSNWILAAVLVVLAMLAAGRFFGLDARLQDRLPRWIA